MRPSSVHRCRSGRLSVALVVLASCAKPGPPPPRVAPPAEWTPLGASDLPLDGSSWREAVFIEGGVWEWDAALSPAGELVVAAVERDPSPPWWSARPAELQVRLHRHGANGWAVGPEAWALDDALQEVVDADLARLEVSAGDGLTWVVLRDRHTRTLHSWGVDDRHRERRHPAIPLGDHDRLLGIGVEAGLPVLLLAEVEPFPPRSERDSAPPPWIRVRKATLDGRAWTWTPLFEQQLSGGVDLHQRQDAAGRPIVVVVERNRENSRHQAIFAWPPGLWEASRDRDLEGRVLEEGADGWRWVVTAEEARRYRGYGPASGGRGRALLVDGYPHDIGVHYGGELNRWRILRRDETGEWQRLSDPDQSDLVVEHQLRGQARAFSGPEPLLVVSRGHRGELAALRWTGSRWWGLDADPDVAGGLGTPGRRSILPHLIATEDALLLRWFETHDQLGGAVMEARWDGRSWSPTRTMRVPPDLPGAACWPDEDSGSHGKWLPRWTDGHTALFIRMCSSGWDRVHGPMGWTFQHAWFQVTDDGLALLPQPCAGPSDRCGPSTDALADACRVRQDDACELSSSVQNPDGSVLFRLLTPMENGLGRHGTMVRYTSDGWRVDPHTHSMPGDALHALLPGEPPLFAALESANGQRHLTLYELRDDGWHPAGLPRLGLGEVPQTRWGPSNRDLVRVSGVRLATGEVLVAVTRKDAEHRHHATLHTLADGRWQPGIPGVAAEWMRVQAEGDLGLAAWLQQGDLHLAVWREGRWTAVSEADTGGVSRSGVVDAVGTAALWRGQICVAWSDHGRIEAQVMVRCRPWTPSP